MNDTTTMTDRTRADVDVPRRGRWCIATALVGVAQGAALLVWPHHVSDHRFSFPLGAGEYVIAQATFFAQHLPLVAAVAALAAMPVVRGSRAAHRALVAATVGLALLAVMELLAMAAVTTSADSTLATTIGALYGIPVLTTGVGLVVAGTVLLRRNCVGRQLPWCLLASGGFVFVGLVPALATDSFVGGRLAIMTWFALFALLGGAMVRLGR